MDGRGVGVVSAETVVDLGHRVGKRRAEVRCIGNVGLRVVKQWSSGQQKYYS